MKLIQNRVKLLIIFLIVGSFNLIISSSWADILNLYNGEKLEGSIESFDGFEYVISNETDYQRIPFDQVLSFSIDKKPKISPDKPVSLNEIMSALIQIMDRIDKLSDQIRYGNREVKDQVENLNPRNKLEIIQQNLEQTRDGRVIIKGRFQNFSNYSIYGAIVTVLLRDQFGRTVAQEKVDLSYRQIPARNKVDFQAVFKSPPPYYDYKILLEEPGGNDKGESYYSPPGVR